MEGLAVIRMKRGREETAMGDFVVCGDALGERGLVEKMQAVGLEQAAVRRRVFRHVASVTESEAQALLADPELLEKKRVEVKLQRGVMGTERDRAKQQQRLKASRLRVLQDRRVDGGARVLDVDVGGKRAREDEDECVNDAILCNGMPMKRVNLSLQQSESVMVDLFMEERSSGATVPEDGGQGTDYMQEVYLELFANEEDDEARELRMLEGEDDPDGVEIDYPEGSSSGNSSDRDELDWARSGDEENENYSEEDMERMRHFDGSIYDDEA